MIAIEFSMNKVDYI